MSEDDENSEWEVVHETQPRPRAGELQLSHILTALILAGCALVLVGYFMDHHQMYSKSGDTGWTLFTFHHGPREPTPAEITYTLSSEKHTGYHHSGAVPVVLLSGLMLLAILGWKRTRYRVVLSAIMLAICIAVVLSSISLIPHLFDRTETLPGRSVFVTALILLSLLILGNVILQAIEAGTAAGTSSQTDGRNES